MPIDPSAPQQEVIAFAGAITRTQFALVQRLLLPWWGAMYVTAATIVIAALVFDVAGGGATGSTLGWLITNLLWSAVMFGFVWGLTMFSRHRQWRHVRAAQQEITGTIGAEGLEWNTPMTTAKYPWSKIVKLRQHPEMLLLFYSANCAFYAPRAFFATEAAWTEANALAARRFPAKAQG